MVSTCLLSLPNPCTTTYLFSSPIQNNIISSSSSATTTTVFRLGDPYAKRTKRQAFRVLANSSGLTSENASSNKMVMVDPLEAKRLAAIQMQEIKARERFERSRRIEAINGAWAMIGLTAGLVIEGRTGKTILDQLADYWSSVGLAAGLVIEGETAKSILDQLAKYWSSVVNFVVQYVHFPVQ